MGRPVKGDIVTVPFPFSDLSNSKIRPALILTTMRGDDIILCQITSQTYGDPYSIFLHKSDFTSGFLPHSSYIRPNKLFTADYSIILKSMGHITPEKLAEVIASVYIIITGP